MIFLSERKDTPSITAALASGAQGYLLKPVDPRLLEDAVELCTATFDHVSVGLPDASPLPVPVAGTGDGLRGSYFDGLAPDQPVIERVDPNVGFDWGYGSPVEGLGRNNFSVRWEGQLKAQFSEPYGIHILSDDRARLWLNGELLQNGGRVEKCHIAWKATDLLSRGDLRVRQGDALLFSCQPQNSIPDDAVNALLPLFWRGLPEGTFTS